MSDAFGREEDAEPIADVNVVPLADVSLVLLIILLVLSPMAAQSMLKVQAAAAKAAPKELKAGEDPLQPTAPLAVLAVGLSPAGYVVDGRLYAGDAEFKAWLQRAEARRSDSNDKKVFLAPEMDVRHGDVVHAIETIQSCGASAVALVQVADREAGR